MYEVIHMNRRKTLEEKMLEYDQYAANLQHLVRHKDEQPFTPDLIEENERSMFELDDDFADFERTLFEPAI